MLVLTLIINGNESLHNTLMPLAGGVVCGLAVGMRRPVCPVWGGMQDGEGGGGVGCSYGMAIFLTEWVRFSKPCGAA